MSSYNAGGLAPLRYDPQSYFASSLPTFLPLVKSESVSRSVVSDSVWPHGQVAPGSSVHGLLQARILEWDSHSLLQGIFPTQKSNPGLLHCRQILYHLRPQGSRNTQFLSSWNILTVLHFSWGEGPQEFKSSSGCLSSTIFFFFFGQKTCKPDLAIVYRYLKSASIYSTHYKEVTGDPKLHCDEPFQGYGC